MKNDICSFPFSCLMDFIILVFIFAVFCTLNLGLFNPAYCQEESVEGETSVPFEADVKLMHSATLKQDYTSTQPSLEISLDPVSNVEKKALEDAPKDQPLQIGFGRDFPMSYRGNLIPLLDWEELDEGSLATSFTITSPDARAIRIALKADGIPDGVEFRFFSLQYPDQIFGPYTAKDIEAKNDEKIDQAGNDSTKQTFIFWSPVIEGDTIGVELYMPPSRHRPNFTLTIPKVSHLFSSIIQIDEKRLSEVGKSGWCNIDIACRSTTPSDLPEATAKIVYTKSGGTFLCTGTLLNDADSSSWIPYFMTANHCVNTQSVADTINSYWFFERSTCGGANPSSVIQRTRGGELIATGSGTDFAFLQLDDDIPFGAWHAGWNSASLPASSSVIGIHHPRGDLKKWSRGTATGFAPYLGNVNGTGSHIRLIWSQGTTEAGSSGSGLFDTGGGFRGNLHGGSASCSSQSQPDWYGRFDQTYPSVRTWLWVGATALSSGVARSGSVQQNNWKEYKLSTPSSVPYIKVELYGLSQDADLFVRRNNRSTLDEYDCKPFFYGTGSEECIRANSGSNTWYIGVRGYSSGTTHFTVRAQFHYSCPLNAGDYDYCRDCGQCDAGEGDCDNDDECRSGLTCVNDVGADYGWPSNLDVCEQPGGPCSVFQPGPDWCRDCGPCAEGEGDCDGDNECEAGLICAQNVGANYGWPAGRDVCEQPPGNCSVFQPGPDWCRECGPCAEGEGDCDGDNECEAGLICAQNVGANYGWPAGRDVCEQPSTGCDVFQPGPDWCRDCGPCAEGEGDCDGDNECEAGLICAQDVGANYGWPAGRDVCEQPGGPGDCILDSKFGLGSIRVTEFLYTDRTYNFTGRLVGLCAV
ncbi:MAG: trypsin-like peptidase domain-containing protein [Desulfosarcina sp.]|nr:trypsin-like peptidase domain-containing protein [Desulfosarcina sp.]